MIGRKAGYSVCEASSSVFFMKSVSKFLPKHNLILNLIVFGQKF